MATYRDALVQALIEWPSLFLNEDDVLDQMFFTVGCGYEWEEGQLVDTDLRYPPSPGLEKRRADPWTTRLESREYRESCSKYTGFGSVYFQMRLGHIGRKMNNMFGSCSNICNLPGNIKPDWIEAAKRAVRYAKSNRMKTTISQRALLKSVLARIKEIEYIQKPVKKNSRKKSA
ncbi:MAG: hypothetical protein WCY09_09065 [Candidatus Omnitrophota bacterium]